MPNTTVSVHLHDDKPKVEPIHELANCGRYMVNIAGVTFFGSKEQLKLMLQEAMGE